MLQKSFQLLTLSFQLIVPNREALLLRGKQKRLFNAVPENLAHIG
jgi:hypothetical protein